MSFYYDLLAKFLVGCGGASVILYSTIGSDLPGMKKSIEIQSYEGEISLRDDKVKRLDEELEKARKDLTAKMISAQEFQVLETSYNNQRDDINTEINDMRNKVSKLKRERYFTGSVFFVLSGGFFAALLTVGTVITGSGLDVQVTIAAVTLGSGWTGIITRLEQKISEPAAILEKNKDVNRATENYEKAIEAKDEKIGEYEEAVSKYKTIIEEFKEREAKLTDALSKAIQ